MPLRSRNPTIYGISALPWLDELRRASDDRLTLATIPDSVWDGIAEWGVDAVWLLGVWSRSPAGARIALDDPDVTADLRRTLRDFTEADVAGSASCIRAYDVDARLGGRDALAAARTALADRGISLILDFVCGHVAPDHRWVATQPSFFLRGDQCDVARSPSDFILYDGCALARGRDPYSQARPDVVQLNVFDSSLRRAVIADLHDIASQCDGVCCERAMLALTEPFARTWGSRAGPLPSTECWSDVIAAVKDAWPRFVFIAEADWDKEWELQQLGFDYCYDNRLYDRLAHDCAGAVRGHLHADLPYQQRLVRYIEKDGGPPAAATFGPARHRAVAVASATQLGARFFHDAQCAGRRRRGSEFLVRRPGESGDAELTAFYRRLLRALRLEPFRDGEWGLCDCTGWPSNGSCENIVAWRWRARDSWALVAVNLSGAPAQSRIPIRDDGVSGRGWSLHDLLSGARYDRDGTELHDGGLFVDLPAWGAHVLITA
jgi:hypothetical protein